MHAKPCARAQTGLETRLNWLNSINQHSQKRQEILKCIQSVRECIVFWPLLTLASINSGFSLPQGIHTQAQSAAYKHTQILHTNTETNTQRIKQHTQKKQTPHIIQTNTKPGIQTNAKKSCRVALGELNFPATDASTTCSALFSFGFRKKTRFASTP